MSIILLRLKLGYNKWYLSQLRQRPAWTTLSAMSHVREAIRDQKQVIQSLETLIDENIQTKRESRKSKPGHI